jgi:hypothetical protein
MIPSPIPTTFVGSGRFSLQEHYLNCRGTAHIFFEKEREKSLKRYILLVVSICFNLILLLVSAWFGRFFFFFFLLKYDPFGCLENRGRELFGRPENLEEGLNKWDFGRFITDVCVGMLK